MDSINNGQVGDFLKEYSPGMSKIKNQDNSFIKDFFLHYMQPFFYNSKLTLEETIEEWRIFGQLYEKVRLSEKEIKQTNFSLLENEIDSYYSQNEKNKEYYRHRKHNLKISAQLSKSYESPTPDIFYNKPFQMPDIEIFKKAEAIGRCFSLASLSATYTGFQNEIYNTEDAQNKRIDDVLSKFYNLLSTLSEEYIKTNNIAFDFLHLNLVEDSHSNYSTINNTAAYYQNSLQSITIYDITKKENILEVFLHEYTHFIDMTHYNVYQRNKPHENDIQSGSNFREVNKMFNLDFHHFKGRFRENELYQIKDNDYSNNNNEFIKDYNNIIHFNITGKKYDMVKSINDMQKIDYEILFKPVEELIKNKLITNTTPRDFIEKNKNYLSDFISSIIYIQHVNKIEECLDLKDDTFSRIIELDKYMKHSFNEENIAPENSKINVLHNLFINIVNNEREIANELEKQGSDEETLCIQRIYNYYSTLGLYIPSETHLDNMFFIENFTRLTEHGLSYFLLPGEMLAYSMTHDLEKKPDYIKKENVKFYNKYVSFLANNIPHQIKEYDENIIKELNVLKEKVNIGDYLKDNSSKKGLNI